MTTHTKPKHELWLLGLCLMIVALSSCTYDYFEDENNFRLYVPQIERGEIDNFFVVFHNASGKHVLTRQLSAPFDKNELMKQGILKFKLPYGENYWVSCFANYAEDATILPRSYEEAHLRKVLADGSNVYASRKTDPRAYLSTATVYPIGHPQANITRIVNIDEKQRYKGKIITNFKDLPPVVSFIDIFYKGLATKYNFDGTFSRYSPTDRIMASLSRSDYNTGNTVTYTDILNPSDGINPFGLMAPLQPLSSRAPSAHQGAPLELEIQLFDAQYSTVGVIRFTTADFERLKTEDPSKVPTDADGNPIDQLVLEPQKTITFTFQGFTIVSIQIEGWGDIVDGEITPL